MLQTKSLLERERCFRSYQVSRSLSWKMELLHFCLTLSCFEGNNFENCSFGTPATLQVSLGLGFPACPIALCSCVVCYGVKASLHACSCSSLHPEQRWMCVSERTDSPENFGELVPSITTLFPWSFGSPMPLYPSGVCVAVGSSV